MALPQEVLDDTCLTVKELAQQIKKRLESGFQFIRVRGEVSGVTYHKSGHVYFSLKESDAVIDCISWKGIASTFSVPLSDGLEIIGRGSVTTYMGRSKYQFIMDSFEPAGLGALYTLLEQRRLKLQAEGLFDVSLKRPIPRLPKRIGLITSSEGAVLHDIQARLEERYIEEKVYLWPVTVQGENTPKDVIAAIEGFHRFNPKPDVIIIARGGGSFEDLWYFNDETLVRAIRASAIPIVTAIGHEPDTPLIDYASDRRASTPTNAAEIVAPRKEDLHQYLDRMEVRLTGVLERTQQRYQNILNQYSFALQSVQQSVTPYFRRLDQIQLKSYLEKFYSIKEIQLLKLSERCRAPAQLIQGKSWALGHQELKLTQLTQTIIEESKNLLHQQSNQLNSSNFMHILQRGFAILQDDSEHLLHSVHQLQDRQKLSIRMKDGTAKGVFIKEL